MMRGKAFLSFGKEAPLLLAMLHLLTRPVYCSMTCEKQFIPHGEMLYCSETYVTLASPLLTQGFMSTDKSF